MMPSTVSISPHLYSDNTCIDSTSATIHQLAFNHHDPADVRCRRKASRLAPLAFSVVRARKSHPLLATHTHLMLLARTLPALVLPRLALSISTQSITATALVRARGGPITVSASALNRASNTTATPLGNLPAPPLGIYSSLVSYQSIRNMGSDSSKVSSSAPKAKSDEEWRTILTPAQVSDVNFEIYDPPFADLDSRSCFCTVQGLAKGGHRTWI